MSSNLLTQRINTYFALLLITLSGAGGTLLIVKVAHAANYSVVGISSGHVPHHLPTH